MNYNAINMPGYGDEITWGPCTNHPCDPRTPDYDHLEQQQAEELSTKELEFLDSLSKRGFAVVVFSPDELGLVDASVVESELFDWGWSYIDQTTKEILRDMSQESDE